LSRCDIGNPPFGHFGEAAIRKWAKDSFNKHREKAGICGNPFIKRDFEYFDGNPQGLRTIMHLHNERDKNGLNLTYQTLLACIKYPTLSDNNDVSNKKLGYFATEEEDIGEAYKYLSIEMHKRYPLSYIVEAADDIAYTLSDIGDGIEKRMITISEFYEAFHEHWGVNYKGISPPLIGDIEKKENNDIYFFQLSIELTRAMMESATTSYIEKHDEVFNGTASDLFKNTEYKAVIKTINKVARTRLYQSHAAERIELSGYAIITGLLNHFSCLLVLTREEFDLLIDPEAQPINKDFDLERRVFNQLSLKTVKCYKYWIEA